MRSKLGLLVLASALAGCGHVAHDLPDQGVESVNVPVIQRADYVFDAAASGGGLVPGEASRLNSWFQGLNLGYGDAIYVDGAYADGARTEIAQIAGYYGMMVEPGAPVTVGALPPGAVRVVVSRNRATVPNCPNWSVPASPNHQNRSMSNFGCGVNSNLAAMVANPEDLIHGREGSAVVDAQTASKAVATYRASPPTGTKGLKEESTKEAK